MPKRILKKDLEATIERLRKERGYAVEALKTIALRQGIAFGQGIDHQRLAHDTLKRMGLIPFHADDSMPPDQIWMLPPGMTSLPVTDYL